MLPAMPPTVSIIVPCYNEQATIRFLLDAILEQTYPRRQMDVVIADGLSQDSTRERIGAFQKAHPDLVVRIVDNPQRTIPSGLNLACAAARGEMLVRLDAHSIPISEYVERCVGDLENGSGSVVGGVWLIRPGGVGPVADGIAEAARSSAPFGMSQLMARDLSERP
jgi:succinoglycan biosynthesis protein ExoA